MISTSFEGSGYILHATELEKTVIHLDQTLTIFKNLNISIAPKETVAIVGTSGSGKSTLLSILSGLDNASAGQLELLQQNMMNLTEDERATLRLNHVGFVFQNFQLMSTLTALENVMLPLEIAGKGKEANTLATEILSSVGLSHRLNHYPKYLSGGEQQRVAIARAFVGKPTILFADEPTGNLDPHTATQVIDLLFELNEQHDTALVLVTHDMGLAKRCGRILGMKEGQLFEDSLYV